MEGPVQPQQPPRSCSSPEKSCGSLDVRVAMLLLTLAGVVILLLLYRLLQLRHRLRLARARHALEYYSFFHSATYTLKHPEPAQDQSSKTPIPEATPPLRNGTEVTPPVIAPLPPPPGDPPPPLLPPPPPVMPPPSLPPAPSVMGLPLSLPVIQTTPPSPHLSWGACSESDIYSRIGTLRPSRLSSLSNQSKVILFEHSSL